MKVRVIKYFLLLYVLMAFASTAHSQPGSHSNMIVSAVSEYNGGNYDKASDILSRIVSGDKYNDAAWYYLAMCSLAKKDMAKAEDYLLHAVKEDPENFWYRYRLARLYAVTSRTELTIDMYEKLLEDFPKKSDLYFDLVELYSSAGENQKALDTINEIVTIFGMTESVAVYRFNLLMRMKRHEEAYESVEEYNKKYSSPYVLTILAEQKLSMYDDSTALAYFNEALDLSPGYSPALLGKAETLRMTRRYDEYFDVLMDFVSSPSDEARAKTDYLSAVLQRLDGKFLKAFMPQLDTLIGKVVDIHQSDSSALHLAGLYYYTTGRQSRAESMFRKNMQANPRSVSVAVSFVEYLMYAQRWEMLSEEARLAFDRFPEETAFLELASVGDYNLEKYDKVLELCDLVIKKAPADSSKCLRAWSTKGDVYHKSGFPGKSYKAYEKALKINPDYVYVLNNYAYYLSMAGKNLKKAYAMSRKTVEAEPDNSTYLDTYGWILYLMGKPEEAKSHFKRAMLYGGRDSAVILDHYAEVLFALGEYDKAMVYWREALRKNGGEIPDLEDRVRLRQQQMKTKRDRK